MLHPVILKIPLLASIFYPVKFIIGSVFSLSLLAALGFDLLFRSGWTQKKRVSWLFAGAAFSFIVFILCREQVAHFFRRLFVITTEDSAKELQRSFWHGLGFLMLYAAILFLTAFPKRPLRQASLVFLIVVAADLVYHNRPINPVISTSFFREPTLLGVVTEPKRIHREEGVPEGLRLSFRSAEGAARYFRHSLYPFCGIGEGIRYLYNEDSYLFYSKGYYLLQRAIAGIRREERVKILQAQGCEYLIGHTPLPGLPSQIIDVQGHSLYIQKINDSVPSAYIVHRSVEAQTLDEALRLLKEERFERRKTAILKSRPPLSISEGLPEAGDEVISTIKDFSADKEFSFSISHPGLMIVPGNSAPGWKAWVDGRPTVVLEALPAARAIPVPAGEHKLILKYRPRSFTTGGLLSFSFLFGLGFYLALSLLRGRKTQSAKPSVIRKRD
jgi:hypothetical protein